MPFEKNLTKWHCQHVRQHISGEHMKNFNFSFLNALMDKVISGMDVFGARVMRWVSCKGFGSLVVDVKRDSGLWYQLEFSQ